MRHLTVGEAIAKRKHLTIYPFVGVLMLSQAPLLLQTLPHVTHTILEIYFCAAIYLLSARGSILLEMVSGEHKLPRKRQPISGFSALPY
ncbi:unnamed protein product [Porites lobata]|uniref:Uncharacterized protein n=1 Tax=Porites lobata TaxID=104759 RepID=A0ABN8N7R5_9CNID|nr:unnamed protein product [Porites lobata]